MAHPRDHILPLSYLGSVSQTDVTKVMVKVRVNGGSATTYTNVSTPAITQNADNTSLYELDIPANTYADGDRVARAWYYDSVIQPAGGVDIIGPASVDGAHYTTARGDNLDNLDVAVSTRLSSVAAVTYTGPVSTGGTVSLIAGDDYKAADSRALTWTVTGGPSLTDATIHLVIGAVTATGSESGGTVSVDVTAAQTTSLLTQPVQTRGIYQLVATLADGDIYTIATGTYTVASGTG